MSVYPLFLFIFFYHTLLVGGTECTAECESEYSVCVQAKIRNGMTGTEGCAACRGEIDRGTGPMAQKCVAGCTDTTAMTDACTGSGDDTPAENPGNNSGTSGDTPSGGNTTPTEETCVPDVTEKPVVPTICNANNMGCCDCGGRNGVVTYVFWITKTTTDERDPAEEQRCFFLYTPTGNVEKANGDAYNMIFMMQTYSDSIMGVMKQEPEIADTYDVGLIGLVNNNKYVDWVNNGVTNDLNPIPCDDSDSMDVAYARVVAQWVKSQGYGDIYTSGFSQNSLWSLQTGVCLREYVEGIAQAGSGVKQAGVEPYPPGMEGQCEQNWAVELKKDCVTDHFCTECKYAPLDPTANAVSEILTSCNFIYDGDSQHIDSSRFQHQIFTDAGHDSRFFEFPGGNHHTQDNFLDWVIGCFGIVPMCDSTCETSFISCVSSTSDWTNCRDTITSLNGCTSPCAMSVDMLNSFLVEADRPTVELSMGLYGSQRATGNRITNGNVPATTEPSTDDDGDNNGEENNTEDDSNNAENKADSDDDGVAHVAVFTLYSILMLAFL